MSNYNYNEIFCKPDQNLYPNMTDPSERMFDAYESGDLVAEPSVGSTAPWLYENCKNWTLNIPFNQGSCKELFRFNVIGDDPTTWSGGTVVMDYGSQVATCNLLNFAPVGDISYLLAGCDMLKWINFNNINVSLVNNLAYAFYNCSSWWGNNLSNWNVSNVTNMAGLFAGCSQLQNYLPFISTWNTYKVNSFYSLFSGCSNLTSLDLSGWNTQNVTNLAYTFSSCSRLSSLNLAGWNILKVTSLNSTFKSLNNMSSLNLSGWNTSSVQTMSSTFFGSRGSIPWLETWDTRNVTRTDLFLSQSNISGNLNLSNWKMNKVTNMYRMFYGLNGAIPSLNLAGWNIGLVNNLYIAISYCRNLTSLNVSGWNTKNVVNCYGLFNYDTNLQTLDLTGWNLMNATNITRMFGYCNKLSNASLQSIATMLLTATKVTSKNLDNLNTKSPFNYCNKKLNAATIGSTLVSQLQANGWTL